MARYHIINDHNIQPCDDDDCGRHHVHVFTEHDLAARDNSHYDAGYNDGYNTGKQHAANTGYAAVEQYLARNRDKLVAAGAAGRDAAAGRIRNRQDLSEAMTWVRWEEEFSDGDSAEGSGIDLTCAVVWTLSLVGALAFWTTVGMFAWKLLT